MPETEPSVQRRKVLCMSMCDWVDHWPSESVSVVMLTVETKLDHDARYEPHADGIADVLWNEAKLEARASNVAKTASKVRSTCSTVCDYRFLLPIS